MSNSAIRHRFLFSLGLLILLALTMPTLAAAEYASVQGEKVNIRSGPGTDEEILWQVFAGYPLQVLKRQGDWTHIVDFEDDKGWIYNPLLTNNKRVIVQVDTANMRVGSGTNYEVMATVRYGVVFEPVERREDWLKVEHADGTTGWIAARLLWPADII